MVGEGLVSSRDRLAPAANPSARMRPLCGGAPGALVAGGCPGCPPAPEIGREVHRILRSRIPGRALPGLRLLLLFLLLALLVFVPWTARSQADTPAGLFYHFRDQAIPLTVVPDVVAVRLAPGATLERTAGRVQPLGQGSWRLVSTVGKAGASEQAREMLNESGVEFTSPVVQAEGARAILTDQILVRFRPDATPEQIDSALQGFTPIPR